MNNKKVSVDNTFLDLLNSSYPTKGEFINCLLYCALSSVRGRIWMNAPRKDFPSLSLLFYGTGFRQGRSLRF